MIKFYTATMKITLPIALRDTVPMKKIKKIAKDAIAEWMANHDEPDFFPSIDIKEVSCKEAHAAAQHREDYPYGISMSFKDLADPNLEQRFAEECAYLKSIAGTLSDRRDYAIALRVKFGIDYDHAYAICEFYDKLNGNY